MQKLLFLFFLFPFILHAQPKVSKTEAFKAPNDLVIEGFVRETNSGNLIMAYRTLTILPGLTSPTVKFKWAVDVFSPDLKRISAGKPVKIEFSDGDDVEMGDIVSLGGTPAMLFYKYEKKEQKTLVYKASIEQGGKIGALKRLGSLDGKLKDHFHPTSVYSADSLYLLLTSPPQERKTKEPLSYLVIDRKWEVIKKGNLNFPNEKAEYLVGQPLIGTDASIWMPVWTKETENVMPQEIWVWPWEKTEPVRIDVSLSDDKLITDMVLRQFGETVYIGGLYAASSKKAKKAIFDPPVPIRDDHPDQGTFVIKLDQKTNAIRSKSAQPFNEATFRRWGKNQKDIEKGDGIDLLVVREVCALPDGRVWVDVEEYYHEPLRGQDLGTTGALVTGDEPRYGPAIAVMYNADGKTTQEIYLGKRTWASVNRNAGHFFGAAGDGILCLYNDHEENLTRQAERSTDLKISRVPNGHVGLQLIQKPACTAMYYADSGGKGKLQKLFNLKETDYWIEPHISIEVTPGVRIFACEGKDGHYGLLKVEW